MTKNITNDIVTITTKTVVTNEKIFQKKYKKLLTTTKIVVNIKIQNNKGSDNTTKEEKKELEFVLEHSIKQIHGTIENLRIFESVLYENIVTLENLEKFLADVLENGLK